MMTRAELLARVRDLTQDALACGSTYAPSAITAEVARLEAEVRGLQGALAEAIDALMEQRYRKHNHVMRRPGADANGLHGRWNTGRSCA